MFNINHSWYKQVFQKGKVLKLKENRPTGSNKKYKTPVFFKGALKFYFFKVLVLFSSQLRDTNMNFVWCMLLTVEYFELT